MIQNTRCNMCGRTFTPIDKYGGILIDEILGYGTKYDGEYLRINMCCECLESMIEKCVISPINSVEKCGETDEQEYNS